MNHGTASTCIFQKTTELVLFASGNSRGEMKLKLDGDSVGTQKIQLKTLHRNTHKTHKTAPKKHKSSLADTTYDVR
jgi:hypothetical protein